MRSDRGDDAISISGEDRFVSKELDAALKTHQDTPGWVFRSDLFDFLDPVPFEENSVDGWVRQEHGGEGYGQTPSGRDGLNQQQQLRDIKFYVVRNSDLKVFDALMSALPALLTAAVTTGKITETAWITVGAAVFPLLRNLRNSGVKLSPDQIVVYSTLSIVKDAVEPGLRVEDIEAYLEKSKTPLTHETIQKCLDEMAKFPARSGPVELVYTTSDHRWFIRN